MKKIKAANTVDVAYADITCWNCQRSWVWDSEQAAAVAIAGFCIACGCKDLTDQDWEKIRQERKRRQASMRASTSAVECESGTGDPILSTANNITFRQRLKTIKSLKTAYSDLKDLWDMDKELTAVQPKLIGDMQRALDVMVHKSISELLELVDE